MLFRSPHEAALDIERTVDVDADENARHRHVLGREDRRPRHYGADLLVDRGDARIDLVGNVGLARPFVLEPVGFLAESRELRLVLVGERRLFRSEEHTSELQSLMRISYAVFCLKKKTKNNSK